MQRRLRPIAVLVAAGWLALSGSLTATAPSGKPEDVGLSTKRLERVGELVQRHLASGSFSGAVTLVARNGRIVHHEAFGVMDLETKKPMPKDGIFRIMSMTKPVVGVATLMMIEEGTIRLTDPVSKFIPEWKDMTVGVAMAGGRGGAPEPRYYTVPVEREITIRDLLTHTNGVVSGPISQSANRAVAAKPTETLADYIPRLGRVPTEFQPGTRWAYSATAAWDTLSRIVEIVSGMPMDRFVKTRIFDPLEMKDTTYVEPIGNPRLVKLYSRTPGDCGRRQPPRS
jgi:CubicO group peptidase (beta-lactamase class C family)